MIRPLGALAAAAMLAGVTALGLAWVASRRALHDPPRWSDAEFVRIDGAGASRVPETRGVWVLPVNPSCSHCPTRLAAFRDRAAGHEENRLVVLIVDAPRRPDPPVIERLGDGVEVWWDARSIWRGRWGYRIYGEPLCFTRSGRFVGPLPGSSTPPRFAPARGSS